MTCVKMIKRSTKQQLLSVTLTVTVGISGMSGILWVIGVG